MAETPLKRRREETEETHVDGPAEDQMKRLKPSSSSSSSSSPYPHNVLSFLDDQLDDGQISSQDLSSLISALQDELASESEPSLPSEPELASPSSSSPGEESDGDEDKEKVFRHLLVASDDELGLPSREGQGPEAGATGAEPLSCDGLWELEDEAANYYTLLQSELFMWGEFAK